MGFIKIFIDFLIDFYVGLGACLPYANLVLRFIYGFSRHWPSSAPAHPAPVWAPSVSGNRAVTVEMEALTGVGLGLPLAPSGLQPTPAWGQGLSPREVSFGALGPVLPLTPSTWPGLAPAPWCPLSSCFLKASLLPGPPRAGAGHGTHSETGFTALWPTLFAPKENATHLGEEESVSFRSVSLPGSQGRGPAAPEVWLPWLRVPKLRPLWPRPLSIGGSRTFRISYWTPQHSPALL